MPEYDVTVKGYGWFRVTADTKEEADAEADAQMSAFTVPIDVEWEECEIMDVLPADDD